MTAEIEFHSDRMFSEGHPAVNVKRYRLPSIDADDDTLEHAFEQTREAFWEEATEIAHERGYSGLFSEGRSGGWMVPFYQKTAKGKDKFHNWPGQGGDLGYPRYPDVSQIGERSRFLAFQRRIQTMLDGVGEAYRYTVEQLIQDWTFQRS